MQTNYMHKGRTPRGQKNWEPWEDKLISQTAGKIEVEKIMAIFECIGSKREDAAIRKRANTLGWGLKVKRGN